MPGNYTTGAVAKNATRIPIHPRDISQLQVANTTSFDGTMFDNALAETIASVIQDSKTPHAERMNGTVLPKYIWRAPN